MKPKHHIERQLNAADYTAFILAMIGAAAILVIGRSTAAPAADLHLPRTILVGEGCEGVSRVAVAWSESALPRCASIEVHWIAEDEQ